MKLIVIGSDPQSQVRLQSQYVSAYHAEIIQLDNGDMLLVDKRSTNGTFLNGQKIEPEKEIPIRRGDNIVFADTPISWSMIPENKVPDIANIKSMKGIGSHYLNAFQISGDRVSRFHATFKEMKDGKWFLCDHSTNGTTVNGSRIPKNSYVRIKKGDNIVCAGVPVQNPVPGGSAGKIVGMALAGLAAVAAVVCAVLFLGKTGTDKKSNDAKPDTVLYNTYEPSTALIIASYYYTVSAGSLDMDRYFNGDKYVIENGRLVHYNESNALIGSATGFFINEKGWLATNLHVAKPWLYSNADEIEEIKQLFINVLNASSSNSNNFGSYVHQVKVEGVIENFSIIPSGQYFKIENAIPCEKVIFSDNTEVDLAIFKTTLGNGKLPEGSTYIPVSNVTKNAPVVGDHMYTIGFPYGIGLQEVSKGQQLKAIGTGGSINSNIEDVKFGFDARVSNGSSGSPIFNKYGELTGVVSHGVIGGYNYAVDARLLKSLYEKAMNPYGL